MSERTTLDHHDWKLDPLTFAEVNHLWGPLEIDLFASRLTAQLPRFFTWRPDPVAEATDAFSQKLGGGERVCLPTFCPNRKMPPKTSRSRRFSSGVSSASLEITTLVPTSAASVCSQSNSSSPVFRPPITTGGNSSFDQSATSRLADPTPKLAFPKGLKHYSWQPGEKEPPLLTPQLGVIGIAGAVNGKLFQFSRQLSQS